MSKSHEQYHDDIEKLEDELFKYKANLTTSLKAQADIEKRLKLERSIRSKEQKNYKEEKDHLLKKISKLKEEKDNLQKKINPLNCQVEALALRSQELEKELIAAKKQISDFANSTKIEEKHDTPALQQNSLNNQIEAAAEPVASEIKLEQAPTENSVKTEAPTSIAPSNYSLFSPWRLLGYKNKDTKQAVENQPHKTLADLTQASIEQAKAERAFSLKR